jgi:uncharacterized protein (UPF0332 family)
MSPWEAGRSEIERLITDRKLQQVPASRENAEALINTARQHLRSARTVIDDDPDGSYTLAYDAARKAMTAYLAVQGLRPTQAGGHVVLTEGARAQLGAAGRQIIDTFERMRRQRHQVEYPADIVEISKQDIEEDITKSDELVDKIQQLLEVLPVF